MSDRDDLIPSYTFDVSLDGVSFSFSKIENLSSQIDIDTIVEGGKNNSPVILRNPKRSPDILVLERGLYTTVKDMSFALFMEGSKIASIHINVKRNGSIVRMFFISGGVVVRREYSPLSAMDSGVLIETLQIAHTGLVELPLPFGV